MLPREIRTLSEAEALRRWADLYAAGKHAGIATADPTPHLGIDSTWVEVEVPHNLYSADWNTDGGTLSPRQHARAEEYARRPGPLPPGMASYKGRRLKGKIYVWDGNHRAYAAFLRGSPTARFYMPRSDWKRFQEAVRSDGSSK